MKLCFALIILIPLSLFSSFDPDQKLISAEISNKFTFPEDLKKTNLSIITKSKQNQFEWAGRIWYESGSLFNPCSGGVVALPGYKMTDKALVLTAGHCLLPNGSFLEPHKAILDQPLLEPMYFSFQKSRVIKGGIEVNKILFSHIVFASFDVVDLALLKMDLTYQDLDYKGQAPPLLAKWTFKGIESITSFGLPASKEYTSLEPHISNCVIVKIVLNPNGYENVSNSNLYKYRIMNHFYNTCTTFPSMSGGYVRNIKGEVIGVNATGSNHRLSSFSSIRPIMDCAQSDGHLNFNCLKKLKKSIESTSKTISLRR